MQKSLILHTRAKAGEIERDIWKHLLYGIFKPFF